LPRKPGRIAPREVQNGANMLSFPYGFVPVLKREMMCDIRRVHDGILLHPHPDPPPKGEGLALAHARGSANQIQIAKEQSSGWEDTLAVILLNEWP